MLRAVIGSVVGSSLLSRVSLLSNNPYAGIGARIRHEVAATVHHSALAPAESLQLGQMALAARDGSLPQPLCIDEAPPVVHA